MGRWDLEGRGLGEGGQVRAFQVLLDRSEAGGVVRLHFDELRSLGRLYRLHATRLARLRERGDDPDQIRHLNALCVRAYTLLYGSGQRRWNLRPGPGWAEEALGRLWRPVAVAWLLLLLGAFLGASLSARDPNALLSLMPGGLGYTDRQLDELARSKRRGTSSWSTMAQAFPR